MAHKTFDDAELRQRLTPLQYEVTQNAGTERAFTGELWDNHADGEYRCIVCDTPLFRSDAKSESGSGWPSFYEAVAEVATTGVSILVVEQFARTVFGVADYAAIMLHGRIVSVGQPADLEDELSSAYLGA